MEILKTTIGSRPEAKIGRSIAFLSEINGQRHRLLLIKNDGRNVYAWTWLDVPDVIHRTQKQGGSIRIETRGSHQSYHWDGRRHRRVELTGGQKDRPFIGRTQPWEDIPTWRQFFVLTVPLADPWQYKVESGPWGRTDEEVLLRASDYNATQLWLNVLISKNAWIERLCADHEASWVLRHDPLSVVIGVWR